MIFGGIKMSWFNLLKRNYNLPDIRRPQFRETPETHAERLWREMLEERGEEDLRLPSEKKEPLTDNAARLQVLRRNRRENPRTPAEQQKWRQILEREQKKLEEAWTEKQRELELQRTLPERMQQLKTAIETAKQKTQEVLEEIKQKKLQNLTQELDNMALQRKVDEAKNALKQYPMLSDMLGQLEAVEDMAQEA